MAESGTHRPIVWRAIVPIVVLVVGGLALAGVVILVIGGFSSRGRHSPPPELKGLRAVPEFSLTNQAGRRFSRSDLEGQVWVADIIFTRCAGPCPRITANLARLQHQLSAGAPVRLISLTADPSHDTPAVLKEYAARFQADPNRWSFLTGPAVDIYRLTTEGLCLAVAETEPAERLSAADLFVHSTKWVLVDQHGQVRQYYDGEDPESPARVLRDIRRLLDSG